MGLDETFGRAAGLIARAAVVFGVGVLALEAARMLPSAQPSLGAPTVAPATAVGFVMAGLALWLRVRSSRRGARAADVTALASGAVVLLGQLGPRVGLLRPAHNTELAFALLAFALLWLDRTVRGRYVSHWLAAAVAAIALFATVGYLFHSHALYGLLDPHWGMAPGTALGLLALAVATVIARPSRGIVATLVGEELGSRVLRRLLPLVASFPLVGVLLAALARSGPAALSLVAALLAVLATAAAVALLFFVARLLNREAALQRRQVALIDECADPIVDSDLDGHVLLWNRAAEQLFGYRADEILGQDVARVVPLDAREALARARAEVVATRTGRVFEGPRVRKDGSTLVAATTLSPILGPDGTVVGVSGVARNVTAERKAEHALTQAHALERRLRRALESGNAAARAVSASLADLPSAGIAGVLREVVEQARSITDASAAAIGLGADPEAPFALWVESRSGGATTAGERPRPRAGRVAEDRPEFERALATPVMFRGALLGTLFLLPRAGGFPADEATALMAQVLADRAGAAVEVARAYEREANERAWLDAVLDQMPEPVVLVGADGLVRRRNRVALSLAAPTPGRFDAYGNPTLFDLRRTNGEPLPFAEWPMSRVLRTRQSIHAEELVVRTSAGVTVPLLVNAAPVYDRTEQMIGAVLAAQDITAIKRVERMRAEWTALVAHDLRQPVSAIRLSAGALVKLGHADPRANAAVERIERASDRLRRMIDDLLQDAQLQADRFTVETQHVDLNAVVGRAVADLGPAAASRRVMLELPAAPQIVDADAERIAQVLGNLLTNAVKYSSEGSEINVAVRRAGREVVVSVTNRGRGIPADELPHVFERFRRSHATQRSGIPGLGLGLAIARGLVEAHGGRIWAESTEHESTTFAFALPLSTEVLAPVALLAAPRSYA